MKHTSGPWEICGATHVWSPSAKANIASCSSLRTITHVGYAPPDYGAGDLNEVAANTRLIAAAPDLLEALEGLVFLAEPHFSDKVQLEQLAFCRAAIAKAKGE